MQSGVSPSQALEGSKLQQFNMQTGTLASGEKLGVGVWWGPRPDPCVREGVRVQNPKLVEVFPVCSRSHGFCFSDDKICRERLVRLLHRNSSRGNTDFSPQFGPTDLLHLPGFSLNVDLDVLVRGTKSKFPIGRYFLSIECEFFLILGEQ